MPRRWLSRLGIPQWGGMTRWQSRGLARYYRSTPRDECVCKHAVHESRQAFPAGRIAAPCVCAETWREAAKVSPRSEGPPVHAGSMGCARPRRAGGCSHELAAPRPWCPRARAQGHASPRPGSDTCAAREPVQTAGAQDSRAPAESGLRKMRLPQGSAPCHRGRRGAPQRSRSVDRSAKDVPCCSPRGAGHVG